MKVQDIVDRIDGPDTYSASNQELKVVMLSDKLSRANEQYVSGKSVGLEDYYWNKSDLFDKMADLADSDKERRRFTRKADNAFAKYLSLGKADHIESLHRSERISRDAHRKFIEDNQERGYSAEQISTALSQLLQPHIYGNRIDSEGILNYSQTKGLGSDMQVDVNPEFENPVMRRFLIGGSEIVDIIDGMQLPVSIWDVTASLNDLEDEKLDRV